MTPKTTLLLLLLLNLLLGHQAATAQALGPKKQKVVQLSGQVVAGDSLVGLEGASVYVPGTTRGTHSRQSGYFSLPVLAGDSMVISMLGYGRQYVKVPANFGNNSYTVVLEMKESATALPTVDVMPWATEYDLKQAVLNTRLAPEPADQLPVIPPPVAYRSILDIPPMSAAQNFRYGQQQIQQGRESRYKAPNGIRIFGTSIR